MRAMLVVKDSKRGGAETESMFQRTIMSLNALNISYSWMLMENFQAKNAASQTAVQATHDMIILPELVTGYKSFIDNANITLPLFGLNHGANAPSFYSDNDYGVTGAPTVLEDQWVNTVWSTQDFQAFHGRWYTGGLTVLGTALMTVKAAQIVGEPATPLPGAIGSWFFKRLGGAGSTMYNCGVFTPTCPIFHFILQAAINNNEFTTAQLATLRKSPVSYDLDHINGNDVTADPSLLHIIAGYIPAGGMMTCGVFNGGTEDLEDMARETYDNLVQYQNEGKFRFCYHEHREDGGVSRQPVTTGTFWPNTTDEWTKEEVDGFWQDQKTVWEALYDGELVLHNEFYNSGANNWNEQTLQLMSPNISKNSSPADDTTQAGYGFRGFRSISSGATVVPVSRRVPQKGAIMTNYHHTKRMVNGMMMLPTWDWDLVSGYDTISEWRILSEWYTLGLAAGLVMYLHEGDFVLADQDPGVNGGLVGIEVFDTITDHRNYLKDVAKYFANPIDYMPQATLDLS